MSLTRRLLGAPVSVESTDGATSFAFPALDIPRGSLVKAYFRYEDGDVDIAVSDTAGGIWRVIRQFNGNVNIALAWSWNHPGGAAVQITGQLGASQSWRFGAAWAESGGDLADPAVLGSLVAANTFSTPLNHFVKSDPFADTTHVSGCYNNASGATVANAYLRAVHSSAYSLSAVILGRRLSIRQAAFTASAGNTASISLAFRAPASEYAQARSFQRRIMVAVPSGGTETSLTVAEASHGHTSDSLSLTTATALTAADSAHAHTADGLTLSTGTALVVAEASHAHTADALTLSTGTSLAVGDALHSHTADAPALTTNSALAVADASHGHTSDNLTLSAATGDTLAVQDSTHAHGAEALTLNTAQHLAVGDAAHAHAADAPLLSTQILLTVSDAAHAHSADNITLSDVPALVIASVMHAHAADSVALTSQSWLAAQDAFHAHQADNLSLSAFDANDELYPLAGLTQEWPRAGSQTFPLAGLRQNFPLE